ncbi:MAG: hypothetical protein IK095_09125 [Oscillospiraceae bacterium]|nr:hypothetical protein [Oscillospiraceae bacterium]
MAKKKKEQQVEAVGALPENAHILGAGSLPFFFLPLRFLPSSSAASVSGSLSFSGDALIARLMKNMDSSTARTLSSCIPPTRVMVSKRSISAGTSISSTW